MIDGIVYGLVCTCPGCDPEEVLYVGQTTNLTARIQRHKDPSTTERTPRYKWIHEHGARNIEARVLEKNIHPEHLDSREKYWIREKNTFILDNPRAKNSTRGGSISDMGDDELEILRKKRLIDNFNSKKLSWEDVKEIRRLYSETEEPVEDIAERFNIVSGTAYAVIMNRNWVDESYTYKRRSKVGKLRGEDSGGARLKWKDVREIRSRFCAGEPVTEIAERFGISMSNVKDVGYGYTWPDPEYDPPTRGEVNVARKERLFETETTQQDADTLREEYAQGSTIRELMPKYAFSYERVTRILNNELKPTVGYTRPRRQNTPISEGTRDLIKKLIGEGYTAQEVANKAGVSIPTVRSYQKRSGDVQ